MTLSSTDAVTKRAINPTTSVRIREVDPSELMSEEELARRTASYRPFFAPWECPEPHRSLAETFIRLEPIFEKENAPGGVLAETPLGIGFVWRAWKDDYGIVLGRQRGPDELVLDDRVTFFH